MLTADLVKSRLRQRGSELTIDMLDTHDPHWLATATELITLIQQHVGRSQAELDKALEAYEGERIDYFIIRGLAKVLTDAATFTPPPAPLLPLQLRERLFSYGPVFATPHLFQTQTRQDVLEHVANELALSPQHVESGLFADRLSAFVLSDIGSQWTSDGLLVRYNLELARGALYWASQMQIEAHSNYKDLWKFLKLFKLMFWVRSQEDGYVVDLDGPIFALCQRNDALWETIRGFLTRAPPVRTLAYGGGCTLTCHAKNDHLSPQSYLCTADALQAKW